jgi:hypothetical protein
LTGLGAPVFSGRHDVLSGFFRQEVSVQPRLLRSAGVAAGVASLSIILGACDLAISGFHEEARDTWSKTYPLAANGTLEIVNANGSIQVESADAPRVEVHVERIAHAVTQESAKEMLRRNEIREDVSSDRVHLEMSRSSRGGFFGHGNIEARYTVRVPANTTVDLRETNGRVEAIGLTHNTRLSTTNGQITGRKLNGVVRVSTTNGRVDLQMVSISEDLEAETTNGTISLRIPTSANADISARVVNGHIGIEGLPSMKADDENSRRRFSGRLNNGGHQVHLQTTNGSITITGGAAGLRGDGQAVEQQPVER